MSDHFEIFVIQPGRSLDISQPITSREARGLRDIGRPMTSSGTKNIGDNSRLTTSSRARGLRNLGQPNQEITPRVEREDQ